jgi:hypothetical protein
MNLVLHRPIDFGRPLGRVFFDELKRLKQLGFGDFDEIL